MRADLARLAALGIPDPRRLTLAEARALRPDMIGQWLPYALLTLCGMLGPVDQAATLRAWGLDDMADRLTQAETNNALDAIRKLTNGSGDANHTGS